MPFSKKKEVKIEKKAEFIKSKVVVNKLTEGDVVVDKLPGSIDTTGDTKQLNSSSTPIKEG